ncbi:phospholipase A2 [Naviculisporaceae sp. PSN 640]
MMGLYQFPLTGLLALLSLSLPPRVLASGDHHEGCHADNCARAVTGTHRGSQAVATARADCSSFMKTTVTASPAVTITATLTTILAPGSGGQTNAPEKRDAQGVPAYADNCPNTSRYSSACSCWGITAQTQTVTPTSTITVTKSVVPGPTYTPPIPSSYSKCIFDPSSSDPFDLLDPNSALPIIKNGTLAKVVQEVTDPWIPVRYKTVTPTGAPAGVFDLQLEAESGPDNLVAIYEDGTVGFVATSSNGQGYVEGPAGKKYVTSVFSFTCKGRLTAGIVGGSEFHFIITDDQRVTASIFPLTAAAKRDIPVPEGFYVIPPVRTQPPSGQRCPNGQSAVPNGLAPTANGCGAKDGIKVPNLTFGQCCDGHDICFGTCSEGFAKCNNDFYGCMLASCAPLFVVPAAGLACTGAASTYYLAVRFLGDEPFAQATKDHCECKCDDPSLTACDDKCVDTKSDPLNCGSCFFNCPSGACTNGACSFKTCAGSRCGAFGSCGPGGSCVCASITNGNGFCVNGETPCDGLASCGTSADCPLGSVCAVGTCCQRNVCITTDQCGGFNSKIKRAWVNATIAQPGN